MSLSIEFDLLRAADLFSELSATQLKRLLFASQRHQLGQGEFLFHQGDQPGHVFVVVDGDFAVLVSGDESHKAERDNSTGIQIAVRTSGEIVGEIEVFTQGPRIASIQALTPSDVIAIDGELFLTTVTQDPPTALKAMQLMSHRLADISNPRGNRTHSVSNTRHS